MTAVYVVISAYGDDDEVQIVAVFLDEQLAAETAARLGGVEANIRVEREEIREEAFGVSLRVHHVKFDRYTPDGSHYSYLWTNAFREEVPPPSVPRWWHQVPTRSASHPGRWEWFVHAEAATEDEAWALAREKMTELIRLAGDTDAPDGIIPTPPDTGEVPEIEHGVGEPTGITDGVVVRLVKGS